MQAQVGARATALRARVDAFDSKQALVIGKVIRLRNHQEVLGAFGIAPALGSLIAVRDIAHVDGSPWPTAFRVLTSNFDQLSVWFAPKGEPVPRRVYVESEIRLLAYQHNRYFQAAVIKTALYESQKKQRVPYEQLESRSPEQVVGNSMLAEGITLEIGPIHTFSLFGERLLESLSEYEMRGSDCRALERRAGHRHWYCSADWPVVGIKLRIGRRYAGGCLVELEFFTQEQHRQAVLDDLRRQLERDLPVLRETPDENGKWHAHATEIHFDQQAMANA